MASFDYPNETAEYRKQRDQLLEAEVSLRDQIEAVAAKRRTSTWSRRSGTCST